MSAPLPRVVLFDLDDTLLHFSAGQPDFWRLALERFLPAREDHAALLAALASASSDFWGEPERAFWGRQNMIEARRRVARAALATSGVERSLCERIADEMTEQKESQMRLVAGALETLAALRERGHRLALLTNGCSTFQRRKLARFELEPLFELILVEGELGYGKPDRRVFEAALRQFDARADEACMIGDNLDADIAGAQVLGISAIWFDAHGTGFKPGERRAPERVIVRLSELVSR
jgi:putative hydrolase of the HAD superfamily